MAGLNCGTVSSIAWPVLREGVDFSIAIDDASAHRAVQRIESLGLRPGPCGAGCSGRSTGFAQVFLSRYPWFR